MCLPVLSQHRSSLERSMLLGVRKRYCGSTLSGRAHWQRALLLLNIWWMFEIAWDDGWASVSCELLLNVTSVYGFCFCFKLFKCYVIIWNTYCITLINDLLSMNRKERAPRKEQRKRLQGEDRRGEGAWYDQESQGRGRRVQDWRTDILQVNEHYCVLLFTVLDLFLSITEQREHAIRLWNAS